MMMIVDYVLVMMIVDYDGGDDSNYQTDYRASLIIIVMIRLFSIQLGLPAPSS